jgi:hypothetical protein
MARSKVIDLARWRSSAFRCEICARLQTVLVSVRLSRWIDCDISEVWTWDSEDYRRYKELTTFRVGFICRSCYYSFHFEPGWGHGFYEHDGKMYRLSIAKPPVEYDRAKWLRYVRRRGRQEGR